MSREYPGRPMVGIGGVVVLEERVLLVKRARPPLLGEWSIPGGAMEAGETLHECLRRELWEETGLAVKPGHLLEVLDRIQRDEQGRARYHYVLIDYLCAPETPGQVACAASDASECRWFARSELAALNLHPDTLRVIEKALAAACAVGEAGQ